MATTSECIMFTIMAAETLRESRLLQNHGRGRPNQTFEEEFHVCILFGVTRATLIFLLDLLKLLRLESE